jgi:hypothetical protein
MPFSTSSRIFSHRFLQDCLHLFGKVDDLVGILIALFFRPKERAVEALKATVRKVTEWLKLPSVISSSMSRR